MTDPSRPRTSPERLTRRADYLAAGRGRRFHTPRLTLQGIAREPGPASGPASEEPRFGLTVSRKVGNAVERNRVKRRLRAVLRQLAGAPQGMPGQACFDYVLVARRDILSTDFQSLITDVVQAIDGLHRKRPASPGRPRSARRGPADSSPPAPID